jgi:tetratricopeptide (TPR) repeat protein
MTSLTTLRAAVSGLTCLAAAEEQLLLGAADPGEAGHPGDWAAVPLIAHITEFKRQQVVRLQAITDAVTPPEFAEVDHESAVLYAALAGRQAVDVARDSWAVTGELVTWVRSLSEGDLLDPARHPWLRGRQLWLQIIVRGFWHPTGHLGEYYLNRGQPERAVALAEHAVATADYLAAPDPARGMARYNLACAQARAGHLDAAQTAIGEAIRLNSDLRANTARDRDLAALRESGRLAALLPG